MSSGADMLKRKIDSNQKDNKKRRVEMRKPSSKPSLPFLPADELPIAALKKQLIDSVTKYSTTIVVGETGSGKSTQLVQYLIDEYRPQQKSGPKDTKTKGVPCVACTQPRRVAAVTIAQRVAFERNVTVGDEVGYSIRFEDKTSSKTRIKFVTDGVLLRECMSNPDLENYDIIILDEAHERSLQTDILMGLLRQLQDRRPSLRLVIMSATLQVELFMDYFKNPALVTIPGRQYPVDIYYTAKPEPDYVDAAMLTCLQVHEDEDMGGVLVFLPGQDDIESLQGLLEEHLPSIIPKYTQRTTPTVTGTSYSTDGQTEGETGDDDKSSIAIASATETNKRVKAGVLKDFEIRPLYAAMPPDEQLRAFAPAAPNVRKFVLSTNIAETSVTISGIKYVVDTGFVKTRLIQSGTGLEMLKTMPVSKAQANQRAGRAGRESEGKAFRLFTEHTFEDLEIAAVPEIQRVNVAQVILQLKVLGVESPQDFPYISPPTQVVLRKAFEQLLMLGALGKDQSLSPHGRKMAALPLDPVYSNLLLRSQQLGCVAEVLTAVSMLSSDNVFVQPYRDDQKKAASQAHKRFASRDGDLPTLVNIYEGWLKSNQDTSWTSQNYLSMRALRHAHSVRAQLCALLQKPEINIDVSISCKPEREPFLRCLTHGLFLNVAKRVTTRDVVGGSGLKGGRNASSAQVQKAILEATEAPYRTIRGGQPVHIHPSSVLFSSPSGRKLPDFVVYAELLITSKQYMRSVTAIEGSWLHEAAPSLFKSLGGNSELQKKASGPLTRTVSADVPIGSTPSKQGGGFQTNRQLISSSS